MSYFKTPCFPRESLSGDIPYPRFLTSASAVEKAAEAEPAPGPAERPAEAKGEPGAAAAAEPVTDAQKTDGGKNTRTAGGKS